MTDAQLYLAIGLPVFAVVMNILAGVLQTNSLNGRFTSLESNMNARFASIDSRFAGIDARFDSLDSRFETLLAKL